MLPLKFTLKKGEKIQFLNIIWPLKLKWNKRKSCIEVRVLLTSPPHQNSKFVIRPHEAYLMRPRPQGHMEKQGHSLGLGLMTPSRPRPWGHRLGLAPISDEDSVSNFPLVISTCGLIAKDLDVKMWRYDRMCACIFYRTPKFGSFRVKNSKDTNIQYCTLIGVELNLLTMLQTRLTLHDPHRLSHCSRHAI